MNDHSKEESEELNTSLKKLQQELKEKTQQLNSYLTQKKIYSEKESNYLEEIDVLQVQLVKQEASLSNKIKSSKEEISSLENKYDTKLQSADDKIQQLELELKQLEETNSNNDDSLISTDDQELLNNVMDDELEDIKNQFLDLESEESEQQTLRSLINQLDSLNIKHEEQMQIINQKEQVTEEMYYRWNEVQEEMMLQQENLKSRKVTHQEKHEEGSLFSEVNTKRLELQEALVNKQKLVDEIEKESIGIQKYIHRLHATNNELRKQIKDNDHQNEEECNKLSELYENVIETLEMILKKTEQDLHERNEITKNGPGDNVQTFLDEIVQKDQQAQSEIQNFIDEEYRVHSIMVHKLNKATCLNKNYESLHRQALNKITQLQQQIEDFSKKKAEKDNMNKSEEQPVREEVKENEIKSILKNEDKENVPSDNSDYAAAKNKKVAFTEETGDSTAVKHHPVRRGGKVLKVQTIVIPKVSKKKCS